MVRKRSFLLVTLGFPVLIAAVMAIAAVFSTGRQDRRAVGYVDQANVLLPTASVGLDIEVRAFESLDEAQRALEVGEVQAVYLMPGDYLQSRRVELYYWDDPPGDAIQGQFRRFIRASVAAELPDEIRERATEGAELVVRSADGRRQMGQGEWLSVVLPLVAGVLFMVAIMTSAGYLLQAVTTEKENRTMELMITAVSPEQLMVGKALGLMGVSLSQLLVWVVTGAIAVGVATRGLNLVRLGQVPWSTVGVILAFFVPGYALVGGIMASIGSAVTEHRQGQQIAAILNLFFMAPFFGYALVGGIMASIGSAVTEHRQGQQIAAILNLFFMAPFFLLALILAQPNSPLMVIFTLFPPTAFLTVVLRWSVSLVPWWQLVASWVLLVVTAAFSLWCAARILRAGMLRYGQRLSLRSVLDAVRGRS
jgi:ABC-2 type transport system permease protein